MPRGFCRLQACRLVHLLTIRMTCRDLVRYLRRDEFVLYTKGLEGIYDLSTSTMFFVGGPETGTHFHVDLSQGCNIAFELLTVHLLSFHCAGRAVV